MEEEDETKHDIIVDKSAGRAFGSKLSKFQDLSQGKMTKRIWANFMEKSEEIENEIMDADNKLTKEEKENEKAKRNRDKEQEQQEQRKREEKERQFWKDHYAKHEADRNEHVKREDEEMKAIMIMEEWKNEKNFYQKQIEMMKTETDKQRKMYEEDLAQMRKGTQFNEKRNQERLEEMQRKEDEKMKHIQEMNDEIRKDLLGRNRILQKEKKTAEERLYVSQDPLADAQKEIRQIYNRGFFSRAFNLRQDVQFNEKRNQERLDEMQRKEDVKMKHLQEINDDIRKDLLDRNRILLKETEDAGDRFYASQDKLTEAHKEIDRIYNRGFFSRAFNLRQDVQFNEKKNQERLDKMQRKKDEKIKHLQEMNDEIRKYLILERNTILQEEKKIAEERLYVSQDQLADAQKNIRQIS